MFEVALEAFGDDEERYRIVLESYAEDLFERSKYSEAGLCTFCLSLFLLLKERDDKRLIRRTRIVFTLSNQPEKAILSYQHSNDWEKLFTVAYSDQAKKSDEEIRELAVEIAGQFLLFFSLSRFSLYLG